VAGILVSVNYILAIDPGSVRSSYCLYSLKEKIPRVYATVNNECLLSLTKQNTTARCIVIEKIASYGMPVGETIFDTVVWTGRFFQWFYQQGFITKFMRRAEVKMHLCNSMKARDSNVIQVLKDRYGNKGTKNNPGILYGIKKDEWQALALAVTFGDIWNKTNQL
jgi:hypothetical protein